MFCILESSEFVFRIRREVTLRQKESCCGLDAEIEGNQSPQFRKRKRRCSLNLFQIQDSKPESKYYIHPAKLFNAIWDTLVHVCLLLSILLCPFVYFQYLSYILVLHFAKGLKELDLLNISLISFLLLILYSISSLPTIKSWFSSLLLKKLQFVISKLTSYLISFQLFQISFYLNLMNCIL